MPCLPSPEYSASFSLQVHFDAVNRAGGYAALHAAVAYRAWRLNWHNSEIASEMGLRELQVRRITARLVRCARWLDLPTYEVPGWRLGRRKPKVRRVRTPESFERFNGGRHKRANGSPEQILDLWNKGRGIVAIYKEVRTSPQRVVRVLKHHGVFISRRNQYKEFKSFK